MLSKMKVDDPDPIIGAVKTENAAYPKNTGYSKSFVGRIGKAEFYAVDFTGEDGKTRYQNYACQIGNKAPLAATTWQGLLLKAGDGLVPRYADQDLIKLIVISLLAFAFAGAVIWIALQPTEQNKSSLQALIGIVSGLIGYLIGNSTRPKTSN